nr:Chain A, jatrophidin [Jatropha curcas]
PGLLNLWG